MRSLLKIKVKLKLKVRYNFIVKSQNQITIILTKRVFLKKCNSTINTPFLNKFQHHQIKTCTKQNELVTQRYLCLKKYIILNCNKKKNNKLCNKSIY